MQVKTKFPVDKNQKIVDVDYVLKHEGVYEVVGNKLERVITIYLRETNIYQSMFVYCDSIEPFNSGVWNAFCKFIKTDEQVTISWYTCLSGGACP